MDRATIGFRRGRTRAVAAALCALVLLLTLAQPSGAQPRSFDLRAGDVDVVVFLDEELRTRGDGEPWRSWLRTGISAAHTVTGGFPRDRVLVDLRAAGTTSGGVAFGQIRRSRPPRVRFWVSPDAELDELNSDWHSYHEFAHLLIPFPGNRDIWFTEGLASYYQYLLQSRAGVITPESAWRELLAGFERGADDRAGRGRTLRSLSPDMRREHAYKRVYWTGAAYFLRVDTRLRTESNGRHSLDEALAAFHRCCLNEDRDWNARALIETLGRLSIPRIWHREYAEMIDREAYPDVDEALRRLGITPTANGPVFGQRPEQRALRRAIAGVRDRVPGRSGASAP